MTGFGTDDYRNAQREMIRALEGHKDIVDRLSLCLDLLVDKGKTQESVNVSMAEFEEVDRRLRTAQEWLSNSARHLLILSESNHPNP